MTERIRGDVAAQMRDRMGMSYEQMGHMIKGMMNDDSMGNMMNGTGSEIGGH